MPIPSSLVGCSTEPRHHTVDARWLMAYAAVLGDLDDVYLDTSRSADGGGAVVGHPLFPVCVEWPSVLDARSLAEGRAIGRDELRRGVHASHDLAIHRLVQPGDDLVTTATVELVQRRRPGAFEVLRLDTTTSEGEPVATTRMGSLFLGVEVAGDDVPAGGDPAPGPPLPPPPSGRGARLATSPMAIPANLGHTYTECARIYNPIHTDRAVALAAGLPGPILHGTATLALAVSKIVARTADGDPHRVRRVACRFGAMVGLPSRVVVRVFDEVAAPGGGRAVRFAVANEANEPAVRDGVVVLDDPADPGDHRG